MGAGPTKSQITRALHKAARKASEFTQRTGKSCLPRLQRASNGECAIVYDVFFANNIGNIQTYLNLEDAK